MNNFLKLAPVLSAAIALCACGVIEENRQNEASKWTFGKDVSLLRTYADCEILGENGAYIAVSPKLGGRVMVATLDGASGKSLGWYNRNLVAKKDITETSRSIIGGLNRFSLAPEGGQYALFFGSGDLMIPEKWKAPQFLGASQWNLVFADKTRIALEKSASVKNAKGAQFDFKVERQIMSLNKSDAEKVLSAKIPDSVDMVAFAATDKITNTSDKEWQPDTGLIAAVSQSCFNAGKSTYVFIPYKEGDVKTLGNVVSDNYFQPADEFRLFVSPKFIRFRADAKKMVEIGVLQQRAKGVALSYNADKRMLIVVSFSMPKTRKAYVGNTWKRSDNEFAGDALSVYNNGPANDTSLAAEQFYEISTNSPALKLGAKKSQINIQRVFQFSGSEYELGKLAEAVAGISIEDLRVEM